MLYSGKRFQYILSSPEILSETGLKGTEFNCLSEEITKLQHASRLLFTALTYASNETERKGNEWSKIYKTVPFYFMW